MSFLEALRQAGVETGTARGFWGGVATDGTIVVTGWRDQREPDGGYRIWRPTENQGGLKAAWDRGDIAVGTEVRLIVLKARQILPLGQQRQVADGKLMPGTWRLTRLVEGQNWSAVVSRT